MNKSSKSLLAFFFVLFFVICNLFSALAQNINHSAELKFVNNLIRNQKYNEAIHASTTLQKLRIARTQRDSLVFFEGWAYYNIMDFDHASIKLDLIDTSSTFYFKSKFYSALCNGFQKRTSQSIDQIKAIIKPMDDYPEFPSYCLASYYLLNRNIKEFDHVSGSFTYAQKVFSEEEKKLFNYRAMILKERNKSPLVAGALSAFVPGLGKYYAGYRGQSLSAFIPTMLYAIFTAESYYRMGAFKNDPGIRIIPFAVFGTTFSVFYLGNIIGSAKSVNTFKERNKKKINNEILLDLSASHRRIFD